MNGTDFIRWLRIMSDSNVFWKEIAMFLSDEDIHNLKDKVDREIADRTAKQLTQEQPTKQWGFKDERAN